LEAASGREVCTLEGHTDGVISVAFSPDGKWIVSGGCGRDSTLKVWDASSGQKMRTLEGHLRYSVNCVAFSLDGMRIVSGSPDKTLKVWDLASGQDVRTLEGHSHSTRSVEFSPKGTRIVSVDEGGTLKLWDASSG
jgi:WD40 repeat protein